MWRFFLPYNVLSLELCLLPTCVPSTSDHAWQRACALFIFLAVDGNCDHEDDGGVTEMGNTEQRFTTCQAPSCTFSLHVGPAWAVSLHV